MADSSFVTSLMDAVSGKKKAAPPSDFVVVDHPENGFVGVPREMAVKSGWDIPPGILPDQIPKTDREKSRMAAIYRINKAARQRGEKVTYGKSPEVVIDDPREGLISVPSEVASRSGYAQILRIKPSDIPMDAEARKAATAKVREDRRAREIADDVGAEKLRDANTAADKQFAALNAPPPRAVAPVPVRAPTPPPVAAPPSRVAPVAAAPPLAVPTQAPVEDPDAEAKAWTRDFVPQATGFAPDEGAALMALAKASGRPAGAPLSFAAPDVEGTSLRTISPTPQAPAGRVSTQTATAAPMPSGAVAQGAGSEPDYMAQFRDAQRSDGYSQGIRALGDQFRDAMNLILNRHGSPSNMAAREGGYVSAVQQQRALAEAQAKARRDERLTDATVAGKETAKATADAKAEKTKTDAEQAAQDADPTSESSRRAQKIAKELLGDRVTAETLAGTPANQIGPLVLKYGVSRANAETMANLSGERNDQAAKNAEHQAAVDAARLAQGWAQLSLAQQKALIEAETNKQTAATKADDKVDAQTKDLSEAYDKSGGPGFYSKYNEASDIIRRNPKDLPGIGFLDGKKPEFALSKDGHDLQGAVGGMLAEYRKGITGAGMSNDERKEYGQITGLLYSNSEASVKQGVERLKRAMDARVTAIAGGYKPEAVARYAGRVPIIGSILGGERTTPSESMPIGPDGNPTVDGGTAPAPAASPRPALPSSGTSSSGVRTVSVKGMKAGDLKRSLADGETVRYPLGNGKFQVTQRKGDKLLNLRVEDK